MIGIENCLIATDALDALKLYERIFDVNRIEVTSLPRGQNETIFSIYGTRFHVLDENLELNMIAPKQGDPTPIWFNVTVPDITTTYKKAIDAKCVEISPIAEVEMHGVKTAMFLDTFGFIWQLHEAK